MLTGEALHTRKVFLIIRMITIMIIITIMMIVLVMIIMMMMMIMIIMIMIILTITIINTNNTIVKGINQGLRKQIGAGTTPVLKRCTEDARVRSASVPSTPPRMEFGTCIQANESRAATQKS